MKSSRTGHRKSRRAPWHDGARSAPSGPEVTGDIAADAGKFVQGYLRQQAKVSDAPFDERRIADAISQLRVASRRDHVCGLAIAYGIYAAKDHGGELGVLVDRMIKQSAYTSQRVKSKLRCIIEGVIAYGDDSIESLVRARNLYSRDEQAIRHLIHEGIAPKDVVTHSLKPGEGVVKWSRSVNNSHPDKTARKQTRVGEKIVEGSRVLSTTKKARRYGGWAEYRVLKVEESQLVLEPLDKGETLRAELENVIPIIAEFKPLPRALRRSPQFADRPGSDT